MEYEVKPPSILKCKNWAECKTYLSSKEGRWLVVLFAVFLFPFFILGILLYYINRFRKLRRRVHNEIYHRKKKPEDKCE